MSPIWRADSLLSKEPETIRWIDSFVEGDVFWDIGANVGIYTLYAATKPGIQVLAFEPAVVNLHVLSRNIEMNHLDGSVQAYCLAFTNTTKLDTFHMRKTSYGGAGHNFGEPVNWRGEALDVVFKQATMGFSIDHFIAQFEPAFPNHIKIDVDGIEGDIIEGATETLRDPRLRSVLVELAPAEKLSDQNVEEVFVRAGFRLAFGGDKIGGSTRASPMQNHIFAR